jgi:hypothetical protein
MKSTKSSRDRERGPFANERQAVIALAEMLSNAAYEFGRLGIPWPRDEKKPPTA